ncbi:MAG TPA: hypothetical protein VIW24_13040 [Aldersonia sp.]
MHHYFIESATPYWHVWRLIASSRYVRWAALLLAIMLLIRVVTKIDNDLLMVTLMVGLLVVGSVALARAVACTRMPDAIEGVPSNRFPDPLSKPALPPETTYYRKRFGLDWPVPQSVGDDRVAMLYADAAHKRTVHLRVIGGGVAAVASGLVGAGLIWYWSDPVPSVLKAVASLTLIVLVLVGYHLVQLSSRFDSLCDEYRRRGLELYLKPIPDSWTMSWLPRAFAEPSEPPLDSR